MNVVRKAVAVYFCVVQAITLIGGHPITEIPLQIECPGDSVSIEGTCKCDHEKCSKPLCEYQLTLTSNFTDVPGSCCPTYSCDECPNENRIDGKCPCAPGAILNVAGICKCVDPHKTLSKENECVCDTNKCELPHICDSKSVLVKTSGECCTKTECVTCPDDSYSTAYNDQSLEDKCICFPCPATVCGKNQTAVVYRRGKGFPEMCCDLYKCEPENKTCTTNDGAYAGDGDVWVAPSGERCKCDRGVSLCSLTVETQLYQPCELHNGTFLSHLENATIDSCTNCTCNNGKLKCIAHLCDVKVSEVLISNCSPLSSCKKKCSGGFKMNKQGCEICKCKYYEKVKYNQLENWLLERNMTENDLISILSKFPLLMDLNVMTAASTTSTTTSTTTTTTTTTTPAPTTISSTPSTTVQISDKTAQNDAVENEAVVCLFFVLIGAIIGILGTVSGWWVWKCCKNNKCIKKSKKSFPVHYIPVKETVDKNLNIKKR